MADYLIQDTTLDAIADAINAKTGGTAAMTPAEMVTEIGSIQTGTAPFVFTVTAEAALYTVRDAVLSATGYTDIIVENQANASAPATGFYFYGGIWSPHFPGRQIDTTSIKANGASNISLGSWATSAKFPAGTVLNVWPMPEFGGAE